MDIALDKSALFAAMEAFWQTDTGNDKGVEAAIAAYIERMGLAPFNEMAARKRAALAAATTRHKDNNPEQVFALQAKAARPVTR
ncbi:MULTISPECIES: hypothetical protein [unclassified Ensifer]|uniref:hypothetical protein n=1 Tax=unclassified Ensifer TaxID=2633371 RepID=UPI00081326FE|nr:MULTISPECIES: hypothetical protein [unclassified Ensifer]OCP17784.1 hypothetical protein BC361_10265 [Ensifer sp. LC54]OCP28310.1 hypothetical protein BC363_00100 [Ensifer sp. LC384]